MSKFANTLESLDSATTASKALARAPATLADTPWLLADDDAGPAEPSLSHRSSDHSAAASSDGLDAAVQDAGASAQVVAALQQPVAGEAQAGAAAVQASDGAAQTGTSDLGATPAAANQSDLGSAYEGHSAEVAADVSAADSLGNLADGSLDSGAMVVVDAPGPAGTLQTLANYLRVGFWQDFLGNPGASQRYYNIDDNGTGANFGTLYYNVTWSPDDGDGISAARQVMAREAFNIYEAVLGINFVETVSTATHVDFFFGDNVAGRAYAYSNMHAGDSGPIDNTIINVAAGWSGGSSNIGGTNGYTFQTFIHEIGHGLGLGHQGLYNAGSGTPTYANSAIWDNDSWALTMMSYWDQVENTSASTSGFNYAMLVSPMTVDWIALNALYGGQDYVGSSFGVDQAFTGNTIWGNGTNIAAATSVAYNGLAGFADTNAFTIVDGGGIDTISFSNYGFNQLINLNAASAGSTNAPFSNVGGYTGNMSIAAGTVIENAVGGSGNDTLIGNSADNNLQGGGGNDSIDGGDGNDTVDGGTGADTLWGGFGNDLYIVDNLGDVASEVAGGVDTVESSVTHTLTVNLENLTLTGSANINGTGNDSRDNVIIGNNGANVLSGLIGNDNISGGLGEDTLFGGDGNDTLAGNSGVDTVYGEAGNDLILFTTGNFYDNVDGGLGTDTIDATEVNRNGDIFDFEAGTISGYPGGQTVANIEIFLGGQGNETIISDGNSHTYNGNGGDDYMIAEIGGETMDGGVGGTDTIDLARWNGIYSVNMTTGASNWGGELYTNFENLVSGNGSDTITGTAGNNVISTNGDNDFINGGGGSDTINAGAGDDTVTDAHSSPGDVFDGGTGVDTLIADFTWNAGVTYDLTAGWMRFSGPGGTTYDTILNFENLTAGGAADVTGTATANVITITDTGFLHNNTIATLGGNDTISSGIGNDTVNAGAGNDSVNTGDGDDVITDTEGMGASDDDVYDGGAGTDTLVHDLNWVSSVGFDLTDGFSTYFGNRDQLISIENLTVGGSASVRGSAVANVLIVNGTGANVINGEAGNDTIDGGGGNDTINAGSGNDSVIAGDGNDIITDTESMFSTGQEDDVYNGGAGIDTLVHDLNWVSSVAFDLTAGFTTFVGNRDQLISIENLTVGGNASVRGSAVANVLIVNGFGANVINGEAGNDTIDGGGGDDTISGGTGDDSIIGGDGADNIDGDDGVDTLWGGVGNDTLWGASAGVVTDGGDLINGEAGNDVIGGSYGNDSIDGGADNDAIYGDEGNDTLLGGTGADYIQGDWGWGLDPTGADSINGGDGNDTLLGGAANDTILGGDGNDSINGGTGNDSMAGGLGDDTYIVDSALDVVTEANNAGLDTVYTVLATYSLGLYAENLTLNGAGSQTGYGNKLANVMLAQNGAGNWLEGGSNTDSLVGGAGNDRLIGGTGVDTMVGGLGDDRYSVDGPDVIVELLGQGTELVDSIADFFTLPDNVENLANRLTTGIQYGRGNALDNLITGNSADDDMVGYDGNDTIVGNAGNDTLNGGNGNDIVSGGDNNDSLLGGDGDDSITGGSGDDTMNGNAGNDTLVGGDGNDSMIGVSGNDSITGGSGNDTLSGGADNDTLVGGLGDDDYLAVSSADTLTEFNAQGYDRVFSNSSLVLPTNFEYLELTGGANGTGNSQDNTLIGNASNNTLSGLGGMDILYGRGGNDSLFAGVDAVEDRFVFDTALSAATNVDTLFEADWGEDQIMLDNDIFTALLPVVGTLSGAQYFEGAGFNGNGAPDGIGIWYNLTTGGLYYNPTAGVAGDSILFAAVNGASPTLSNLDFTLFSD